MTAIAYKRPFAKRKGCISERQQPAKSGHSRQILEDLFRKSIRGELAAT